MIGLESTGLRQALFQKKRFYYQTQKCVYWESQLEPEYRDNEEQQGRDLRYPSHVKRYVVF